MSALEEPDPGEDGGSKGGELTAETAWKQATHYTFGVYFHKWHFLPLSTLQPRACGARMDRGWLDLHMCCTADGIQTQTNWPPAQRAVYRWENHPMHVEQIELACEQQQTWDTNWFT